MRVFLIFVAFLLANLLLAAALLYPLHALLTLAFEVDPDRLLYRSAMLLALLGFWPLLRWLRLADRQALGLDRSWPQLRRELARGFVLGVIILAVLSTALVTTGVRQFEPWTPALGLSLAAVAVSALIGGLLIGVIEEVFFRGAMFEGIRRQRGPLLAALLTALLYAALHFMRPAAPSGPLGWDSGFAMLAGSLWRYADFGAIADSFVALVTVGLFLALVRWKTGGIAIAIGLHAGWVWVIKLTKRATDFNPEAPAAALVGSYDHMTGWLAAAWLLVLGAAYWRWGRRQS
jgi:membrane protease YdiL (CAAX protease family)